MTTAAEVKHILMGTAGHIDHGKTRLVGRLTNIDTDRLPEEKARGISIDLGFAHWETEGRRIQFGIVDVPGHERFVKNMVAGATGVNLALLVVAADDGVMPQTREHLEIMDLLGVETGVVAVTKTDLVEPDFVELVVAEIEEVVAGTFMEGCRIVPVSSETGEGIDALRETLTHVAADLQTPELLELFRMPIDRVFSIAGHGTVATGSVLSGDVHAGDTLELLPDRREVRVRSVQNHGRGADDSGARQRTAVNLASVKIGEIGRGQELATPGFLRPTARLVVALRSLGSSPVVLKDRMQLNLHLGTTEVPARIILKGSPLKPGQRAYAELRVKEPVVAAHGQRFILRRISPALTLAGGTILDPFIAPHKRIKDLQAYGTSFDTPAEIDRLSVILAQQDTLGDSPLEAAWRAGVRPAHHWELIEQLKSKDELVFVGAGDRKRLLHRDRLASLAGSVMRAVKAELARHQPRRALPRNTLSTACRGIAGPDLLDAVFAHLLRTNDLVKVGPNLGPADAQVKLTKNQRQMRDRLLEVIAGAGLAPPTIKEFAAEMGQKIAEIDALLNLSVEDGLLVRVSEALCFSPDSLEQARLICESLLNTMGEATMSQLREAWGISRKFAVPLCEYFDACGLTIRKEDVRVPGPKLGEPVHV